MFSFFKRVIYIFRDSGLQRKEEQNLGTDSFPRVANELGQSQELGASTRSLMWVSGIQTPESSSATLPGTPAGNWIESRAATG